MGEVNTVISWIEKNCRYPSKAGRKLYNKRVVLMEWQKEIIHECFTPAGSLKKNKLVIFSKRKIGKSVLACFLIAYFVLGDKTARGREIPIVASAYHQGLIIFNLLSEIIKLCSPKNIKFRRDQLIDPVKKSRVYVAFNSAAANFGSQPEIALYDEVSRHENSENIKAFSSGMGASEQPFEIFLSNPCSALDHFYFDLLKSFRAEKKLKKSKACVRIYEAQKKLAIDSKEAFIQADPSLAEGQITNLARLKAEAKAAKKSSIAEQEFRRLFLGQNVISDAYKWIDGSRFVFLRKKDYGVISVGADFSLSYDFTCVSYTEELPDDKGYFFRPKYYLPEGAVKKHNLVKQKRIKQLADAGWIILQKNKDVLDQDAIGDDILSVIESSKECLKFAYDPACGASVIGKKVEGLCEVEAVPAYPRLMSPLINNLEAIDSDNRFFYNGNPLLKSNFQNALLTSKQSRNYRNVTRASAVHSIDGVIASLLSIKPFIEKEKTNNEVHFF